MVPRFACDVLSRNVQIGRIKLQSAEIYP